MTTQANEAIPVWTKGDRLRKARNSCGLTVAQFAQVVALSEKTINNYEADKVKPRLIALRAWALATGVPLSWLEHGMTPHGPTDAPASGSGAKAARPEPEALRRLTAQKMSRSSRNRHDYGQTGQHGDIYSLHSAA